MTGNPAAPPQSQCSAATAALTDGPANVTYQSGPKTTTATTATYSAYSTPYSSLATVVSHPVLTTSDPAVVAAYKPAQIQTPAAPAPASSSSAASGVSQLSIGPQLPFVPTPAWFSYNAQATRNAAVAEEVGSTSPAVSGVASESAASSPLVGGGSGSGGGKKKKLLRAAGGEVWEDSTMTEWDDNDFRLFCGDLGNEVTTEMLAKSFSKYPSFIRARVVRDSRSNKSKGYGFVSLRSADDFQRAFKEMNGKYVGNRPIKLRKSTYKERNVEGRKMAKRLLEEQSKIAGRKGKKRRLG